MVVPRGDPLVDGHELVTTKIAHREDYVGPAVDVISLRAAGIE